MSLIVNFRKLKWILPVFRRIESNGNDLCHDKVPLNVQKPVEPAPEVPSGDFKVIVQEQDVPDLHASVAGHVACMQPCHALRACSAAGKMSCMHPRQWWQQ